VGQDGLLTLSGKNSFVFLQKRLLLMKQVFGENKKGRKRTKSVKIEIGANLIEF
jgi:hypothetical protein